MSVGGPTRQDTYNVTVTVYRADDPGAVLIKGTWDVFEGGEIDSEETRYNPGGMEDPVSLGGRRMVGNVTVRRLYRLGRDHQAIQGLINGVGRSRMTVGKQPLDIDGNIFGRPIVYNGTLKRCTPPTHDSNSSEAGTIELEMVVDGFPSA